MVNPARASLGVVALEMGITRTTLASSEPASISTSVIIRSTPPDRSSPYWPRIAAVLSSGTTPHRPSVHRSTTSASANGYPARARGVISSGSTRCAPRARVTAARLRSPSGRYST